ncbi:hypothetical protein HDU79_008522, partial [Rhizoclosmatium sp. JEL0117]
AGRITGFMPHFSPQLMLFVEIMKNREESQVAARHQQQQALPEQKVQCWTLRLRKLGKKRDKERIKKMIRRSSYTRVCVLREFFLSDGLLTLFVSLLFLNTLSF